MVHRQNKFGTFKHKLFTLGQQWIDGLLIILILVEFSNASITCGPGVYSPGSTSPSGDITIEYNSGTPLEITCKVFSDNAADDNLLSHRIRFYRNDERVPEQYVSIINSTAAQLRVLNPPASFDIYKCMVCLDKNNHFVQRSKSSGTSIINALKKYLVNTVESHLSDSHDLHDDCIGVCLNNVFVGYKPINITSFSCISNNWESLTCNWTKPENPIKTSYKIYFRLPGRSRSIMTCPTDSDVRNNTCYWDLSTTPLYRQSYEYYYITIAGQNSLGKMLIPFRFHHYANIIPAEPTKIVVVDQTESSVKLLWSLGTMYFYSYGLIFKIQYKSQWDSDPEGWNSICVSDNCKQKSASNQNTSVQVMNCLEKHANHYSFDVIDLEYSFTRYEFCIYVRTALASEDDKWSAPGCIIANTKASIPKRPPRTDIGSFEYVISSSDKSKRDIVIYWQTIEDYEKGGESFEYIAYYIQTTADQQITTYRSNEIGKSYAKFNLLSTSIGYEFIVISYNNEGSSTECSRVYVPTESDTLHKPESFKKKVYDEQGIFELSWKGADSQKLSTQNQQHFYTLFWCEKDLINPLQCNGYMNWIHLAISVSRYNTTIFNNMEKYIFAISVNSKNPISNGIDKASSSGMVWESSVACVQDYIEITPNRSDESNGDFNDGYDDDMCVKILDNAEDAGLCNVTSNTSDIEIALGIYVPDIPAGSCNQKTMLSNEKINKLIPKDGDDLCMDTMDEFENTHIGQDYYTTIGSKRTHIENTQTAVKAKKVRLQKANSIGFEEIQSAHNQFYESITPALLETFKTHNLPIKFNLKIESTYSRPNVENSSENRAFKTSAREIFMDSNVPSILEESFNKLKCEEEEYTSKGSGFSFQHIDGMLLGIYTFSPMSGSSYLPLPASIDRKRATINSQNSDQQCFKWAILAKHVTEQSKYRVGVNYYQHIDKYNFDGISFPTPLSDVKIFELNNPTVSINIYGIEKKFQPPLKFPTHTVFPLKVVDNEKEDHFDILFITDSDSSHYVYISKFSRLVRSQKTQHDGHTYFCKRCFISFDIQNSKYKLKGQMALDQHKKVCGIHKPILPVLLTEGETLEFKAWKHTVRHPIVIYADFEALLEKKKSEKR
ncbi:hypothetical protein QTP88_018642 [Uroleucon formosanum]